ncbi:hypothetical protein ABVK25_004193 [Lepraria finkii]|uniref:Uncharacterized protein n=1 Tax=Lepraria finkii TaxID=1340010 RepID=A0ABR4BC40_9LECA
MYFHPFTHVHTAGTPFKNLRTFKKLVGSGNMSSVAIVSTMWSVSSGQDEEDGDRRLREKPKYWGDMTKEGARPHRHHGDRASAIKIIIPLLGKDPSVLNLQKELGIERSQPHRSGSRSQRGNEQAARNAREDNRSHEGRDDQSTSSQRPKMGRRTRVRSRKIPETDLTRQNRRRMKLNMAKILAE